ncbi:NlpC/P60 family protein [Paenibacillus sp. FSL W8-0194]|uniref:C40 family peptidase n=1 Tax=Paenibacillus sp. FSL W8-0194 TaxID=2921711 RepID=UPI0030DA7504
MINIKKSILGCFAVSAAISAAFLLPTPSHAAEASAVVQSAAKVQTGLVQASVRLRDKPSLSSHVLGYLKRGERVTILAQSTPYYYKVKTSSGEVGYTSASGKYIQVATGSAGPSKPDGNTAAPKPSQNASAAIEKVIQTGMKYLGTPYEFGSNRNTTTTFDCSDFIRQIFKEGAGLVLPADSRQQGAWIKEKSTPVYDVGGLKRGDILFFMSYRGSSSAAYQGIDKSSQRITHVAMYLGDGKLLHTYSQKAGGVVVTDFTNSWKYRFLYGGSVLK